METILVVDDQRSVRLMIESVLSELTVPNNVVLASNGKEALSLFDECQPTVVITDIVMPEMDGFELIQQLSSKDNAPRIIAMTDGNERVQSGGSFLKLADILGSNFSIDKRDINDKLLSYVEKCLA